MPATSVGPHAGTRDLVTFFWLALLNTTIISVVGVALWVLVH